MLLNQCSHASVSFFTFFFFSAYFMEPAFRRYWKQIFSRVLFRY